MSAFAWNVEITGRVEVTVQREHFKDGRGVWGATLSIDGMPHTDSSGNTIEEALYYLAINAGNSIVDLWADRIKRDEE
jgi:hypothetical protein